MMIIDATDLITGRLATYVAKQALLGEKIVIVNSENALISGKKESTQKFYDERVKRGDALKGPYTPRLPDRMLRRTIRGMLPYKQEKGAKAYKRVSCYLGIPLEYKDKEIKSLSNAHISKSKNIKYITLKQLSKSLGK